MHLISSRNSIKPFAFSTFMSGCLGYTCDTFSLVLDHSDPITLEKYLRAFFNSPVFKLERAVLEPFVSRKLTDKQAAESTFSVGSQLLVWTVKECSQREMLSVYETPATGPGCTWFALEHTRAGVPRAHDPARTRPSSPQENPMEWLRDHCCFMDSIPGSCYGRRVGR